MASVRRLTYPSSPPPEEAGPGKTKFTCLHVSRTKVRMPQSWAGDAHVSDVPAAGPRHACSPDEREERGCHPAGRDTRHRAARQSHVSLTHTGPAAQL